MDKKRDTKGRFAVGHPGGPGRPKRQTEASYLAVILDECPTETWRSITRRAVADALEGNEKAREWLSKFLVGIPKMPAQRPFTIVVQQLADINPEREAAAAIMAERKRNLFFDFEHQEALMQMESVDGAEED